MAKPSAAVMSAAASFLLPTPPPLARCRSVERRAASGRG